VARPAPDLPSPDAIRALADPQGRLALRVSPGARDETVRIEDGKLLVRVNARAIDGKATQAALALVARALGLPQSGVTLLRGATAREKLVCIAQQG
jgi:uncharacterized protein